MESVSSDYSFMYDDAGWIVRKNGNDRYKKSWEYSYDKSGNVSEIKIVDKDSFNRYCLVKLEYVY